LNKQNSEKLLFFFYCYQYEDEKLNQYSKDGSNSLKFDVLSRVNNLSTFFSSALPEIPATA